MKRMAAIIGVVLLSLFALYPSFYLGLYGDDWLEIWRATYTFGPESHGFLNYITYFLSRYGSFDLIMKVLVGLIGFQSIYFYITAYILRLIASFSFFPLILYITKNRTAALFGVIFFSITAVGLDATNWVFNMPVYIAIALFNLFLLFSVKSVMEDKMKLYLISLIFLILAMFIASVRMTGVLPFVFVMELSYLMFKYEFKKVQQFILRLIIFLCLFISVVLFGQVIENYGGRIGYSLFGSIDQLFGTWNGGIFASGNFIAKGSIEFISYPFSIIGNMLLPIGNILGQSYLFPILGVLLLLSGFWLVFINLKNTLIAIGLFIGITWLFFSFILAWFRDPATILPFTHRYLIVSAVGLTIFLSILIVTVKNKIYKNFLLSILFILILINIYSTRNYLNYQVNELHGAQISEKIWSQMPYISRIGKTKEPLIFYFTGENRQILYGSITFGFPVHMALLYKIDDFLKMPNPVDSIDQVISAVTDGKSLAPFGLSEQPIPVENIYGFRLEGKDHLIDITEEIRAEVAKLLNK